MSKEMLINVSEGEECRIALVENGKLEELYMERTSSTSHVGNIYKGRVTNVEPSIQAAFIDFGLGRNGFLHISDLMPTYFGEKGEDIQETVGRKMARRDRPPIQRCLRRGDDIVVQIIKEGIGTKGPTLSTYLSIPGRILVMMPGMAKMGVSRKIEDDPERRRLRQILDGLQPLDDVGFIIRTAGVGKTKAEIQRDLTYLTRLWQNFVKKRDSGPAPLELYTEGDLVSRTVRDVFTTDVDRLIVDHKEVAKRVKEVVKLANPRTKNKVELYEEPIPLFHKFGIEGQIELMHSRHVPLPSGGSLVIDSTEAIVAIDVNSGKFREHNDAEMTAFKTDMEAADEIPRQLRLRDLGGVIICDFIDLRYERHRRELEQRLHENFQNDRAKTRVLRMSQFGIIEITRQRMRPSLKRSIYFDCPHCKGAGLVKTPESMSLDAMRRLAIAISDTRVARVEMGICPDVAFYLQNKKRRAISELEDRFNKRIIIKSDQSLSLDEVKLELFDTREGLVYLQELGMVPQQPAQPAHQGQGGKGGRRDERGRRPGGDGRGDNRGRNEQHRGAPPRRQELDPHSIDGVEDAVEEREEEIQREADLPLGVEMTPPQLPPPADNGRPRQGDRPPQGGGENEEGGPRRRRRRRRRGGRGRSGQGGAGMGNVPFNAESGDNAEPDLIAAESSEPNGNQRDDRPRDDRPREDRPHRQERSVVGGFESEYDTGDDEETQPIQPPVEAKPNAPAKEGGPRRRRRRRGGRGRGRGGANQNAQSQPTAESQPASENNIAEPEPQPAPEPAPVVEETPSKPSRRRGGSRPRRKAPAGSKVAQPQIESAPVVRTGSADRHLASDEPIAPLPTSRPHSFSDLDAIPDDFD